MGPAPGSQFPRPIADFVIAPDGSHLAMVALAESGSALWVKRMDSSEYRPLQGTQGAVHPFWSPDSRQIGFFAEGKLKTVGLTGDAPFEVGEATSGFYEGGGGAWNRDGVILFRSRAGSLQKVSATGGTPDGGDDVEGDRDATSVALVPSRWTALSLPRDRYGPSSTARGVADVHGLDAGRHDPVQRRLCRRPPPLRPGRADGPTVRPALATTDRRTAPAEPTNGGPL